MKSILRAAQALGGCLAGLCSVDFGVAQSGTSEPVRAVRVFACPAEISASPADVAFGACFVTHRFHPLAAKALGFPNHADRKMLIVGAPLARIGTDERAGCVVIVDVESQESVKFLTAPYPMDFWKNGKNSPQYSGMMFGSNLCVSPGGKWLFVGCKAGGKGFVLNLESGLWFEISDPLMQVCKVRGTGSDSLEPDNSKYLNYGTKAVFADDETLLLASNTMTYRIEPNLQPGFLLFRVVLNPDRGVVSMRDPKLGYEILPEHLEKERGLDRGRYINRAGMGGEYGFRKDPAMEWFNGRLASNTSAGHSGAQRACVAEKFDFYAENSLRDQPAEFDSRPFPEGTWGLPFIERCVPKVGPSGEISDSISPASVASNRSLYAERQRFFPFHQDASGKVLSRPGTWTISDLGLVDRRRNIGWVSGAAKTEGKDTGIFGVFRWDDERPPEFLEVALEMDSSSQNAWSDMSRWGILPKCEDVQYPQAVGGRDEDLADSNPRRPWKFQYLDPEDGKFYLGFGGSPAKDDQEADPGLIYCYDLAGPLAQLGWAPGNEGYTRHANNGIEPHVPDDPATEGFVEVVDIQGNKMRAQLAEPPAAGAAVIKVRREDGVIFDLESRRITRSSLDDLLETLSPDVTKPASVGKPVKDRIPFFLAERKTVPGIGDSVEFEIKGKRRRALHNETFRGNPLLIHFWSPSSPPCMDEMIKIKDIHARLSSQGLTVLGVPWTADEESLEAFLSAHEISWPQGPVADRKNSVYESLGIAGIPSCLLIDGEGKLVQKALWVDDLAPMLEELMLR